MLFRILTLITLALSTTVAASAQEIATGQNDIVFFNRPLPVPDDALQKVQAALGLSEVQVTAVKALQTMRSQGTQQMLQEMQSAQTSLQQMLAQTNPNANDVGNAFLATQTIQRRLLAADEKFRTDFQALLNAQQVSTLASLKTAAGQIQALATLGVLEAPGGPMQMPFTHALPFDGPAGSIGVGAPGTMVRRAIRIQRPSANP